MTKTNRLLLTMNVLLALILVLVLIQFAPRPAVAATRDITACANKKTGALRLATKACTKKETRVSWGATGPAGPAGPTGPTGARGANGLAGSDATVSTTTLTLKYIGDKGIFLNRCGSGSEIPFGDTVQTWNGFSWNTHPMCEITLKVVR